MDKKLKTKTGGVTTMKRLFEAVKSAGPDQKRDAVRALRTQRRQLASNYRRSMAGELRHP